MLLTNIKVLNSTKSLWKKRWSYLGLLIIAVSRCLIYEIYYNDINDSFEDCHNVIHKQIIYTVESEFMI